MHINSLKINKKYKIYLHNINKMLNCLYRQNQGRTKTGEHMSGGQNEYVNTIAEFFQGAAQMADVIKKAGVKASLKLSGIEHYEDDKGQIIVPGNIDLSNKEITSLPDWSCVWVKGNFDCRFNNLTSLQGAPYRVDGSFMCTGNAQLQSLKGGSSYVGLDYQASACGLETLEGIAKTVGRNITLIDNQIKQIDACPESFEVFDCRDNPLEDLYGFKAPAKMRILLTPFVNEKEFRSWDEVPDGIKVSPRRQAAIESRAMQSAFKPVTYVAGVKKVQFRTV